MSCLLFFSHRSDSAEESTAKKSKVDSDSTSSTNNTSDSTSQSTSALAIQTPSVKNGTVQEGSEAEGERPKVTRAQVVAVLPGLGHYTNSDDSDTSESDGDSELDLMGPLVPSSGMKKKKSLPRC